MKRIISLLIVLALLLPAATMAGADYTTAQYSSTRQFLKMMDDYDIKYTWVGIDNDGDEHITINNNNDVAGKITIHLYFDENEENCYLRVWNLIDYYSSDAAKVYQAVNSINHSYKYAKFYADDSDNSVTAEMDLIYRENDVGEICTEALLHITAIIDEAWPTLSAYRK